MYNIIDIIWGDIPPEGDSMKKEDIKETIEDINTEENTTKEVSEVTEKENTAPQPEEKVLPVVVLKGLPVFPYMILHFDVKRNAALKALESAVLTNQTVFLTTQKNPHNDNPTREEINTFGTIAKVKQVLKLPEKNCRVLVEGIKRGEITEFISHSGFFKCKIREYEEKKEFSQEEKIETDAYIRHIKNLLAEYYSSMGKNPLDATAGIMNIENPNQFCDAVCANVGFEAEDKQELLSTVDIMERLKLLSLYLREETEIIKVEKDIDRQVKINMDRNQKEYFLREQLKVIQDELGDKDGIKGDIDELRQRLLDLNVPEYVMEKADKELSRMYRMQFGSAELPVIQNYVETLCEIPWSVETEENRDILNAEKILEKDHYGLKDVKDRILEFLAVHSMSEGLKSPILCLVGPPGVGKTSIASSIAKALNRKYARISLGGVKDEAEIRGHRKTYIGAMPGRIITALKQAGTKNPLILLDEVDKMSKDFKGDPSSALLEVLDSEQNFSFRDHFVELPFDLSGVLFITTANSLDTIDKPLLDRMEVIHVPGYTDREKLCIAKKHLIPKTLEANGLTKASISFTDTGILEIINSYTKEAGVRELERKLSQVMRKVARKVYATESFSEKITAKNVEEYLGKKKYSHNSKGKQHTVGVVTGLAWTQVGGETLFVEVNITDGTGKLELTGSLGDVMKESARAAVSFIRSNAQKYNVDPDFYKNKDIHIHVPEGATPKDGPSAGITMTTALLSALTGKKVNKDVAMTGEITIRGRVLPIGGLKEKSLGAYRAGIKTIIIPKDNLCDVEDIPEEIRQKITFIPAETADDVISAALI